MTQEHATRPVLIVRRARYATVKSSSTEDVRNIVILA
jgi:hypothetical protein